LWLLFFFRILRDAAFLSFSFYPVNFILCLSSSKIISTQFFWTLKRDKTKVTSLNFCKKKKRKIGEETIQLKKGFVEEVSNGTWCRPSILKLLARHKDWQLTQGLKTAASSETSSTVCFVTFVQAKSCKVGDVLGSIRSMSSSSTKNLKVVNSSQFYFFFISSIQNIKLVSIWFDDFYFCIPICNCFYLHKIASYSTTTTITSSHCKSTFEWL